MKRVLRRLDQLQRERAWAAFPFAVVKKFSEDQAGNLAALIAYYAFFSIFPLILVLFTVVGFIAHNDPHLQKSVHDALVRQLPVFGKQLKIGTLHGSLIGLVVGAVLALWSGLGVAKTAQTAWNTVYLVKKEQRPNFLGSTLRALALVVVGGTGLILTSALTGLATASGSVGIVLRVIGAVVGIALDAGLFMLLFRWLTVRKTSWGDVWPGATLAALVWYVLQVVGSALISHKLKGAQSTYGTFALVIGMLSWFYLQAQLTLLAAEVNVVRQYRLWPRALTDAPATEADFRAYESYAERETYHSDEEVDTHFAQ